MTKHNTPEEDHAKWAQEIVDLALKKGAEKYPIGATSIHNKVAYSVLLSATQLMLAKMGYQKP